MNWWVLLRAAALIAAGLVLAALATVPVTDGLLVGSILTITLLLAIGWLQWQEPAAEKPGQRN